MRRFLLLAVVLAAASPERRPLDPARHHLGTPGQPEWEEFAADPPASRRFDLRFLAEGNSSEQTLLIRQRDVRLRWGVEINGRSLGALEPIEYPLTATFALAPGTLRDGENVLSIVPPDGIDDVVVGGIDFDARPRDQALGEATLDVQATDGTGGAPLPCRITIADPEGTWAPINVLPGQQVAARPGVVYTADGRARIGVAAGEYSVTASRGFEWGIDTKTVSVRRGETRAVSLQIRREVDTSGLVACDTHIHTRTHSGHGDSSVEERVLTLAGEGVEVGIATEHNLHADYSAVATRLGLQRWFTLVTGNEVTTPAGHFNIFPVSPAATPPDAALRDWARLLPGMRSQPGVSVIILNHPRDNHGGYRPFADEEFNPVTGASRRGVDLAFDALETTNSGALRSDLLELYRDWFALLNRGLHVVAVGGSDSHDVSRSIVGQARTYVAAGDGDPGRIDVAQTCANLKAGKALVSLGLLADLRVDDRFGPGDLATGGGPRLRVTATVSAPAWSRADRIDLYCDGALLRQERIAPPVAGRPGAKARISWTIPKPAHDVWLVAIATGPGVTAPFWPILKPYQPSSRSWTPRVLAATNPVRIDGDGDGAYTSPREYALRLAGKDARTLVAALERYDEAVTVQAFDLFRAAGGAVGSAELARLVETAAPQIRRAHAAYLGSLRPR
jgi:hypothetical protein